MELHSTMHNIPEEHRLYFMIHFLLHVYWLLLCLCWNYFQHNFHTLHYYFYL